MEGSKDIGGTAEDEVAGALMGAGAEGAAGGAAGAGAAAGAAVEGTGEELEFVFSVDGLEAFRNAASLGSAGGALSGLGASLAASLG